jgi:hypothetical protein
MAHIDGADERGAQQQEENLWRRFIIERRVDTSRALAYLARLTRRRSGSLGGDAISSSLVRPTESAR